MSLTVDDYNRLKEIYGPYQEAVADLVPSSVKGAQESNPPNQSAVPYLKNNGFDIMGLSPGYIAGWASAIFGSGKVPDPKSAEVTNKPTTFVDTTEWEAGIKPVETSTPITETSFYDPSKDAIVTVNSSGEYTKIVTSQGKVIVDTVQAQTVMLVVVAIAIWWLYK
jgi:hypothetical protein